MAQLASGALFAGAGGAGEADALASVSQGRQRACGTEKLDVAAPGVGLQPTGKTGSGAADQPALQRNVGTVAELFSAVGQAGGKHREGSRWVRRHDRPQTAYQKKKNQSDKFFAPAAAQQQGQNLLLDGEKKQKPVGVI